MRGNSLAVHCLVRIWHFRAWVHSLAWELRSGRPHKAAKKTEYMISIVFPLEHRNLLEEFYFRSFKVTLLEG